MRKKDANPYRPIKNLDPPYLTKQQIGDFYDQFTLLSKQVSIKRIVEAMSSQGYSKTDKMVNRFFEEIKRKELQTQKKADPTISFERYFELMINYFVDNNENNEMMVEMLADSESGEISKQTIRDALEDSLGRKVYPAELGIIMDQLKMDDFFTSKIKKNKTQDDNQT